MSTQACSPLLLLPIPFVNVWILFCSLWKLNCFLFINIQARGRSSSGWKSSRGSCASSPMDAAERRRLRLLHAWPRPTMQPSLHKARRAKRPLSNDFSWLTSLKGKDNEDANWTIAIAYLSKYELRPLDRPLQRWKTNIWGGIYAGAIIEKKCVLLIPQVRARACTMNVDIMREWMWKKWICSVCKRDSAYCQNWRGPLTMRVFK